MVFGVRLPLFIMIEYTAFAVVSYGAYRMFKNGITKKQLWGVWIILMSADILFEMPFTSHAAFVYYGFTPFQIFGFPPWWGWINGTAFILIGFILWLVEPILRGWRRLFILFIPLTSIALSYGAFAQPIWMALNWPMPQWVSYLLTLASLGVTAAVTWGIGLFVAKDTFYKFSVTKLK
ncbi:hypothetical protein [Clostridium botulinum]|nr:hypothetical protein [Clostridium botulinum]MCC5422248.1 hypothetical protein [Clostridium botulinum]